MDDDSPHHATKLAKYSGMSKQRWVFILLIGSSKSICRVKSPQFPVADICRPLGLHLSATWVTFGSNLGDIWQQPLATVDHACQNALYSRAHCSASRVFEALSSYPSPGYPPRAALRLPGVRERSPLRGYCGAQSLATFAALREIRVCVLCASREMWVCAVGCPPLGNCNGAVGFPRPLVWGRQQDWQESLKGFILY